jgi:hypothetical protein
MPASYPNSVKVFTTKTTGQTILASHINEPQDEITAIEQGLLQGLEHALFPKTDVGQDLGTTTKRWRNLLVQKIASGITNATKLRIQEVGTSTWITVNADFDGTNWNREDTTQPAQGIEVNNNKEVKYYRAAAGDNPITWTNIFTISTDRITASQAVIGTDPGGTEVLRAQNLRAGATTLTGTLTAPSAVVGTDPGGTEALRAQNLRAGETTITGNLTAPTVVAGTDPGGTEVLRAQNLRAGTTTITGDLTATTAVIGTDPGGTESLRAQNLRAGPTTITGALSTTDTISAPTAVIGTDPGGTEVLRAQNLRAGTTTLTGALFAPTVVAGTDPGGTEVLRAQNLRAGPTTFIGDAVVIGEIDLRGFRTNISAFDHVNFHWIRRAFTEADKILGIECVGVGDYNLHTKGQIIINPPTVRPPLTIGPNSSGQLVTGLNADMVDGFHAGTAPLDTAESFTQTVRCADFRMGLSTRRGSPGRALVDLGSMLHVNFARDWGDGTTIGGPVYTNSVVVGTDPGGTESLRAESARLNAPVLLGSVPQFTMAADPTESLQVATKQYADTKLARNTAETITAQHTFNPSTTGAPFLVGTNASGQLVTGLNADQVDGQHLADLDTRFVNASGDSMSILGVIQPTSNVTSVQFSGLNLSPPVVLRLVMVVRNPTSTRTFLELRVNGETNSSDWAFQYISGQGVTVAAGRITDTSDIAWVTNGFTGTANCTICVGPSGAVIANSTVSDASGTDTPIVNTYSTMKNTTITSLSSIEIVSSVTNGIASGSVFYLEYLAP